MSRMPAARLARIGAWTAAALAWGTTTVVARQASTDSTPTSTTEPRRSIEAPSTTITSLPQPPDGGLVVLRFTAVTAPPQQIIVKTEYVQAQAPTRPSAGSSGGSTSSGGSSADSTPTKQSTSVAPPPPPPAPPATTAVTAPPAPPSSGS